MKKIVIGVLTVVFVICGIGAILLLNKGGGVKRAEENIPKIQGLKDISIQAGEKLPETIKEVKTNAAVKEVTIDISSVDTDKPGKYPITYIYVDQKGKVHKKEVKCTVTEPVKNPEEPIRESVQTSEQKEPEPTQHVEAEPVQKETLPIPKTGDQDWQMAVSILLLMSSSGVITIVCYRKARQRKI